VPSQRVVIHVGELHAAREPTLIRTLLGSCIAACLYDPSTRVGGMNHFMLPHGEGASGETARFGVHAMEQLVYRMQNLGADRRRLVGKVFGGGHVLGLAESKDSVPQRNIRFIEEFMVIEGIPVASRDVGGREGRIVLFATHTGKAYVRRVGAMPEIVRDEQRIRRASPDRPDYGEVTLFDD
jgi:chemotaxis receptor (MCP) glutamine deamidase CheD